MKLVPIILLFCASAFLGCSSAVPTNNPQTDENLLVRRNVAFWRDDSIDIKEPSPEETLRLKDAKHPKLLETIDPQYPSAAISAGAQAIVYVRVFIDSTGHPRKAVVLKTADEIFDGPVLNAIMFCRFSPAVLAGRAEAQWIAIAASFQLSNGVPIAQFVEKERYP